jgi:predicted flap endonuclease-1-like 5' DNA nuclease
MDYKIIDIEGVGEAYGKKLTDAGINTVAELLDKCKTPSGRAELAEQTGISGKLILTWTNHADLMRINGVGPQFSELLEAAGVDTVKEFRHRVADNLQPKLEEVNAAKNLVNRVPSVKELQKMIDQAKELPVVLEY